MVRIIHFISNDGSKERIHLTDDMEVDIHDIVPASYSVESDETFDVDLGSVPMDTTFKKMI